MPEPVSGHVTRFFFFYKITTLTYIQHQFEIHFWSTLCLKLGYADSQSRPNYNTGANRPNYNTGSNVKPDYTNFRQRVPTSTTGNPAPNCQCFCDASTSNTGKYVLQNRRSRLLFWAEFWMELLKNLQLSASLSEFLA